MIVTGGFKHIIASFNLILVGKRRACCRRCPTGKPGTHLPKGSVRGPRSVWEIESPEAVPREFIICPARCRRGEPARLPLLGGRGSRCAPAEAAAGAGGAACPAGHRLGSAPPAEGPAGGAGRDVPLGAGGGVGTVPLLRTSRTARPSLPACCRPAMVPSSERLFDSLGHFGRYRGPALTGGQTRGLSHIPQQGLTDTHTGRVSELPTPTGTHRHTGADTRRHHRIGCANSIACSAGGFAHTDWRMDTHTLTHALHTCTHTHCTPLYKLTLHRQALTRVCTTLHTPVYSFPYACCDARVRSHTLCTHTCIYATFTYADTTYSHVGSHTCRHRVYSLHYAHMLGHLTLTHFLDMRVCPHTHTHMCNTEIHRCTHTQSPGPWSSLDTSGAIGEYKQYI